jgi:hypothetical protein
MALLVTTICEKMSRGELGEGEDLMRRELRGMLVGLAVLTLTMGLSYAFGATAAGAATCTGYPPPTIGTSPVNPAQGGATTITGAGFPGSSSVRLVVSKTGAQSGTGTVVLGNVSSDPGGGISTVKTWPTLAKKYVYLWGISLECPTRSVRIQVQVAGFPFVNADGQRGLSELELIDSGALGGSVAGETASSTTTASSSVDDGFLPMAIIALVASAAGAVALRRRRSAALVS